MRLRPWLSATRIHVAFDVAGRLGFHDMSPFGTHSAARTLAVYASWPRSPVHCLRPRKTRFRRDGLRRRRWDLHPGSLSEVSGATSFLFSQACPGARATVTRMGRLWPARTRKRPRKASTVLRRARRPAPIRFAMPRRAPRVRALPAATRGPGTFRGAGTARGVSTVENGRQDLTYEAGLAGPSGGRAARGSPSRSSSACTDRPSRRASRARAAARRGASPRRPARPGGRRGARTGAAGRR